MKEIKSNYGITLISLIITIIILLILSGIVITQLIKNDLFNKAFFAKEKYLESQVCEEIQIELTDLLLEKQSKNIELTNKIIQQELESRLPDIEVLEDLTGNYKNYKYEIDENYNVHIIGKITDKIEIKVNLSAGTSYITINVQANSKDGSITGYKYIIDGITYDEIQSTYIVENLNPESEHTIKVVAIDEQENTKESREYTFKTEPRTYLYKNGIEYSELTGYWEEGDYNIGTFTKKADCLNLYCDGPAAGGSYWHSFRTTNSIDVSKYTKIVYKFKIANTMILYNSKYYSWLLMGVFYPKYTNYASYSTSSLADFSPNGLSANISGKIITQGIDLTDINGAVYPTVIFAKQFYRSRYIADIDVYEIWLEK